MVCDHFTEFSLLEYEWKGHMPLPSHLFRRKLLTLDFFPFPRTGTQLGHQLSFTLALDISVLGKGRTTTCKELRALNDLGSTPVM